MHEPAHFSRRAAAALPLAALIRPAATPVPPLSAGNDAALLDLGRRWLAAWQRLRDQDRLVRQIPSNHAAAREAQDLIGDRLYAEEMALFDEIVAAPASTLAGLALKAQAVARAHDVPAPGITALEDELARQRTDIETSSALSLALAVMKLAGAVA